MFTTALFTRNKKPTNRSMDKQNVVYTDEILQSHKQDLNNIMLSERPVTAGRRAHGSVSVKCPGEVCAEKRWPGAMGGRKGSGLDSGDGTQECEETKCHGTVYFKMVNFMLWVFYEKEKKTKEVSGQGFYTHLWQESSLQRAAVLARPGGAHRQRG